MKYRCCITLEFDIDSEADSHSDMDFDVSNFIQEHIMEDADTNPIKWTNIVYEKKCQ